MLILVLLRILAVALLVALLLMAGGALLFQGSPASDASFIIFLLGCVGGLIGTLAGAGAEIARSLHAKHPS